MKLSHCAMSCHHFLNNTQIYILQKSLKKKNYKIIKKKIKNVKKKILNIKKKKLQDKKKLTVHTVSLHTSHLYFSELFKYS